MAGTVFYNVEKVDEAIKNRDPLMEHVQNAMAHGFPIEAIVILHSLMENYTYKLLHMLNIPYKASDRLFQCLEYLKMHVDAKDIQAKCGDMDGESIAVYLDANLFGSGLAEAIGEWRKERNLMIHDVAIEEWSVEKLMDLAMEGRRLFEAYEKILCERRFF